MDQLTLTGATMVSSNNNKKNNDATDLELGGSENKNVVVNGSQKAVVAAAANHNHNHKGCCAKKVAPPIQVVFNAPSKDEIYKASVKNIRTSLITMIRFGGYDEAFIPMMKLLLEYRSSAQTDIIEAIGCQSDPNKIPAGSTTDNDNDHYSLVHWAAKRGKLLFKFSFIFGMFQIFGGILRFFLLLGKKGILLCFYKKPREAFLGVENKKISLFSQFVFCSVEIYSNFSHFPPLFILNSAP